MKLTFYGAANTVTGSKALLETADKRVMVDCGLYQGLKELRQRNWAQLPVKASSIDLVVLTHAHIDHSGYVPLLVKNGFSGPVFTTEATRDLCQILLPDSGFLHEKDADYANRHGFSKHSPALPLYTKDDADRSLKQFRTVEFEKDFALGGGLTLNFRPAGHILGAAYARLEHNGTTIVFSGDLGRENDPINVNPASVGCTDYLVVESTYGDRRHSKDDPEEIIAETIIRTAKRGGTVLIPSFAVGRAQLIMYYLMRLKDKKRIPDLPIFLDSPMAINASEIFRHHHNLHRLNKRDVQRTCGIATYTRSPEESKALNTNLVPKVIISASGMATGGRVLHHLKNLCPDVRNTILFVGYQAPGTRGEKMLGGAREVKIHGRQIQVRAEVKNLDMLSAHADEDGIMGWLGSFDAAPKMTFINHGEPEAAASLRQRIESELGWSCRVPEYCDTVVLD